MFRLIRKTIAIVILIAFISSSTSIQAYAQVDPAGHALQSSGQLPWMPKPGARIVLSPEFTPAHLIGLTIHQDNALQFDFLIHRGDDPLSDGQKKEEYNKLVKYFMASLTIPDEDQWVNLSPYEKDRIIKDDFGKTEMGRDLLAQDYILKQITSSLIYPEERLGKEFWDKVYERAYKEYGAKDIPVNTFNKVWIVPDEAAVYESGNTVYVLRNHLKVMLEEDYLSLQKHSMALPLVPRDDTHSIGANIISAIILPALEKEVNEGNNFANLRQIYSGMILATWYKHAFKKSLLGKVYADQTKIKGVDQDPKVNEVIYQQYLKAFKKGVFNYIKEDVDRYTRQAIPRKYFSGGVVDFAAVAQANETMQGFRRATVEVFKGQIPPFLAKKVDPSVFNEVDIVKTNLTPSAAPNDAAMSSWMTDEQYAEYSRLWRMIDDWKTGKGTDEQLAGAMLSFARHNGAKTRVETLVAIAGGNESFASARVPGSFLYLIGQEIKQQPRGFVEKKRPIRENPKPRQEVSRPTAEEIQLAQRAVQLGKVFNERARRLEKEAFPEPDQLLIDALDYLAQNPMEVIFDEQDPQHKWLNDTVIMFHNPRGLIDIVHEILQDHAMNTDLPKGGIDLNAANLNLQIKRDGKGVPLPLDQQNMTYLMQIQGFMPVILEIKPAFNLPILCLITTCLP